MNHFRFGLLCLLIIMLAAAAAAFAFDWPERALPSETLDHQLYLPAVLQREDRNWIRFYNDPNSSSSYRADDVKPTSDSGFVVAGHSSFRPWIMKTDRLGHIEWELELGDVYATNAGSFVDVTTNGGYVLLSSESLFGYYQPQIVGLDTSGNVIWRYVVQIDSHVDPKAILATADGGALALVYSRYSPIGNWLLKLGAEGSIEWQRFYPVNHIWTYGPAIRQTGDGGYVIAGASDHIGASSDATVMKLNADGLIQWQKAYGEMWADADYLPQDIITTQDGGYLVVGHVRSAPPDGLAIKLDGSGNIVWQKAYAMGGVDEIIAAVANPEGGFILAGNTTNLPRPAIRLLSLNDNGTVVWSKEFAGSDRYYLHGLTRAKDGDLLLAGSIHFSEDGEVAMIAKLPIDAAISDCNVIGPLAVTATDLDLIAQDTAESDGALTYSTYPLPLFGYSLNTQGSKLCPGTPGPLNMTP